MNVYCSTLNHERRKIGAFTCPCCGGNRTRHDAPCAGCGYPNCGHDHSTGSKGVVHAIR